MPEILWLSEEAKERVKAKAERVLRLVARDYRPGHGADLIAKSHALWKVITRSPETEPETSDEFTTLMMCTAVVGGMAQYWLAHHIRGARRTTELFEIGQTLAAELDKLLD